MKSLRNKIAQMLIMGFSGCELTDQSPVVNWLKKDGLGGVLLFDFDIPANSYGKNLKDHHQIIKLTKQLNDYNHLANSYVDTGPLFIAIDYEGGAVDRLAKIKGSRQTMQATELAGLTDEALYAEAEKMAVTLKMLGFNLNFAPVVDLDLIGNAGIIGKLGRSFSAEPSCVIRAAQQFIKAFWRQGIISAIKHFPGHGSASGDTHVGCVDVSDSYQNQELEPYIALSKNADVPAMVMTAHVINRQLDPSGLPATLSFAMLTGLLRHELGFNGVIVSDDLQMQAISHHYSLDESLRLTINAGADMMILGNQLGNISATEVVDRIERLVLSGSINSARIDESFHRIVHLKHTQLVSSQESLVV